MSSIGVENEPGGWFGERGKAATFRAVTMFSRLQIITSTPITPPTQDYPMSRLSSCQGRNWLLPLRNRTIDSCL